VFAWRSSAALAHLQLGDYDEARRLADEEVTLARPLGQPRTLGVALRAAGLTQSGCRGIELLREAVGVLESSPARLEHARAMTDLGAALRRSRHRAEAREPLGQGLDLAHRCGATALAERARRELLATGARPRRLMVSGRDSLTPSEARIARMAAEGLSTPAIAQALFVTPKTVETHLGHAYQKLEINSRHQLAEALH
jgi:DNA-binding CsgD family transcriptional regulator